MSAHPPPVPPANRSDKGPGEPATARTGGGNDTHPGREPNNLGEQDRQGNTKQNTTNKGLQQDR